jgi:predicted RecA/RadA family phage recombinase
VTLGISTQAVTIPGTLTVTGTVKSDGNATAMGAWTTPSFSAGNFTASGTTTWTVGSGDVTTYSYMLVGKTLTVSWLLATTTVGAGGAGDYLKINLFGFTVTKTMNTIGSVYEGVVPPGWVAASAEGRAGETFIRLYNNVSEGGTWTSTTDATYLKGQIVLEID